MSEDNKRKNEFFETQNPWIKRLGLFLLIVGLTVDYWKEHLHLFMILFIVIIILAIVWGILKFIAGDIKDLFK